MEAMLTERFVPEATHPLILDVVQDDGSMSFHHRYALKVLGPSLEGTVGFVSMSSRNVLDDDDADDYCIAAEQKSLGAIINYLGSAFPGQEIHGCIQRLYKSLYHQKPESYSVVIPCH
jgi:hypothetical protein